MVSRLEENRKKHSDLERQLRRYVVEQRSDEAVPVSTPAVSTPLTTPVRPQFAENNEVAYENPLGPRRFRDTYGENILTGALDNFSNATQQLQSNLLAGVAQIPTDVAGMVDLVRVGAPAVVQSIPDDPNVEDDNYLSRLAQRFTDGVISPQAQAELADNMSSALEQFVSHVPNATDEQVNEFLRQYQDSEEFFDLMTSKMSPGFKIAQQGNKWANEVFGVGKRPDQQTSVDDIEQLIGQSIIGVPASVAKSIMGAARRKLGSGVVDNVASRVALRAAELVSPVTLPLTPGNVVANAAVGTVLNEGIRVAQNMPNIVQGGVAEFTPEELEEVPELATLSPEDADTLPMPLLEEADGHGTNVAGQIDAGVVAGGVSAAAIFGLPAFRRQAANAAAQRAKKAINEPGLNGGPSLAEQSNRLDPMLSPTAGMADVQAPIRRGANQFELEPQAAQYVSKGQMIDAMDAHLSTASPTNVIDSVSNVINHGVLANAPDTIPVMTIRRAAEALPPPERDLLSKYAIAKQRQQDELIKRRSVDEELRSARLELSAAQARNDGRAIANVQKKISELTASKQRLDIDDPNSRNLMVEWTRQDVDDIIRAAEANPNIMGVAEMQRRSGHDMLNYQVRNGYITSEEATTLAANRDFWFPVRERAHPDVDNKLVRKGLLFIDRVKGKQKQDTDYYTTDATRNLEDRSSGKVNKPKEPILALQEAWSDAVRSVTANNARRNVIDTLRMFKGAEGRMFRQFEYNGRKSFSADEYYSTKTGLRDAVERHGTPLTRVLRNGKFEFYEFSDPVMTRAMEFAPLATIGILNATRKAWQNMTTGVLAPWFAAKALTWDVGVARTTMKNGRSLGLLDTYSRTLAEKTKNPQIIAAVNNVMDHVPDPLAVVSVAARIPYAASMRAVRAVGHKIADDLALNSGMFATLAKLPGGRKLLNDIGTGMVKTFDRSVFNVYNRNLSTTMGLLQENTRILDDYSLEASRMGPLGESVRNAWRGYKAIVESVQGATRLAFFSENYARLKAKHGGTVPKGELAALVKETRDLSGDMSKYSGNELVQKAASVIPYLNPAIQGTRHIFGAMIPPSGAKAINKLTGGKANLVEERTNRFWSQFTGGIVLPAVASYTLLSEWQGALEYWENNVPEWRQLSGIPIPSAAAVAHKIEHGEWPAFSPEMLTVLEVPPELSMILNPVMAGLRGMGVINNPVRVPTDMGDDLRSVLQSFFSFATPPLVKAYGALTGNNIDLFGGEIQERNTLTFGGANADMRTYRSDMSQQVYDMIGAMASSAGQLFAQTFDVFDMSLEETENFGEAWDRASETFKSEVVRRFPDVPGLWNSPTREYAFTPESQYVFETERTLDPLIGSSRQQSVETDSKDRAEAAIEQGLTPPSKISDPLLKEVSQLVYDTLRKKGPYKEAAEMYSNLRADLNMLEASRAQWPETAYRDKLNEIVSQQQAMKQIQARELQNLEQQLIDTIGPVFEAQYGKPFSYSVLSDLVRQNVRQ